MVDPGTLPRGTARSSAQSRPESTSFWTGRSSQAAGTTEIRPSSAASLRAQPGPSGLALLALAAHGDDSPECRRGIDYLRQALRDVRRELRWAGGPRLARLGCVSAGSRDLARRIVPHDTARVRRLVSLALLLLAAVSWRWTF